MIQNPKFHKPFSPTIMESEVPKRFVDIINNCVDPILADDKKSIQWDWSHKLVGKVHKEVQIPISNERDIMYTKEVARCRALLGRSMASYCYAYAKERYENGKH